MNGYQTNPDHDIEFQYSLGKFGGDCAIDPLLYDAIETEPHGCINVGGSRFSRVDFIKDVVCRPWKLNGKALPKRNLRHWESRVRGIWFLILVRVRAGWKVFEEAIFDVTKDETLGTIRRWEKRSKSASAKKKRN